MLKIAPHSSFASFTPIGGEEITITQDNQPVAKISPIATVLRPLKRGSAKGKVWMSSDFDAPLEDFKEVRLV